MSLPGGIIKDNPGELLLISSDPDPIMEMYAAMLLIEPPCATDGGRVARNWDAKIKIFNFPFLALCKKGKVEVERFHLKRMVIITITAKKIKVGV